jgi:hypothetical protein
MPVMEKDACFVDQAGEPAVEASERSGASRRVADTPRPEPARRSYLLSDSLALAGAGVLMLATGERWYTVVGAALFVLFGRVLWLTKLAPRQNPMDFRWQALGAASFACDLFFSVSAAVCLASIFDVGVPIGLLGIGAAGIGASAFGRLWRSHLALSCSPRTAWHRAGKVETSRLGWTRCDRSLEWPQSRPPVEPVA